MIGVLEGVWLVHCLGVVPRPWLLLTNSEHQVKKTFTPPVTSAIKRERKPVKTSATAAMFEELLYKQTTDTKNYIPRHASCPRSIINPVDLHKLGGEGGEGGGLNEEKRIT